MPAVMAAGKAGGTTMVIMSRVRKTMVDTRLCEQNIIFRQCTTMSSKPIRTIGQKVVPTELN